MGANAARSVLDTAVSLSASPDPVRKHVEMALHPSDFATATAMRTYLEMEHDPFFGLILHLGMQALR